MYQAAPAYYIHLEYNFNLKLMLHTRNTYQIEGSNPPLHLWI